MAIREEKIKGMQIGKLIKLSLFAYDMLIFIDNDKQDTRKLLELINESTKHITKQRHYFAHKDPSSQGYGLSSSHIWM